MLLIVLARRTKISSVSYCSGSVELVPGLVEGYDRLPLIGPCSCTTSDVHFSARVRDVFRARRARRESQEAFTRLGGYLAFLLLSLVKLVPGRRGRDVVVGVTCGQWRLVRDVRELRVLLGAGGLLKYSRRVPLVVSVRLLIRSSNVISLSPGSRDRGLNAR